MELSEPGRRGPISGSHQRLPAGWNEELLDQRGSRYYYPFNPLVREHLVQRAHL